MSRVVRATVATLSAAALLTGCGGARHAPARPTAPPSNTVPASAPGTLAVTPAHPGTTSRISFRFIAPVAAGVHGNRQIGYTLSIVGRPGARCVSAREATVPSVARGASARVWIGPAQLGGPWCAGTYAVRAIELQRPHCRAGVPCPQNVRVVAIVARATFTVHRG